MAYEMKPGQGSLFANRKRNSEKAPTLTGKALVQVGDQLIDLEISAWQKESEKAGKWLSLSVRAKGVRDNPDVANAFATNYDRKELPGDDDDAQW